MQSRNPMNSLSSMRDPFLFTLAKLSKAANFSDNFSSVSSAVGMMDPNKCSTSDEDLEVNDINRNAEARTEDGRLVEEVKEPQNDILNAQAGHAFGGSSLMPLEPSSSAKQLFLSLQSRLSSISKNSGEAWCCLLVNPLQRLKSEIVMRVDDILMEKVEEIDGENASGIENMIPLVLDSVHFKGGTLMLLAYGDMERSPHLDSFLPQIHIKRRLDL